MILGSVHISVSLSSRSFQHINEELVGVTNHFHQLEVAPKIGKHILTLVDENGETITKRFEVME